MTREVVQHPVFKTWLFGLRDRTARGVILRRLDRIADGNLGDVRPVGDGVSEFRIAHGPGYRLYFVERAGRVIVLLCGGDKGSQTRDIARAKTLAQEL